MKFFSESNIQKMKINFHKYQGTGNDFIMIDNRLSWFPLDNVALINAMCDRRFGIGADGLILLENDPEHDFKMTYYNSDGNQSTMCGNGGRCIVQFAHDLGVIENETTFSAIDGLHHAKIIENEVSLQMIDVEKIDLNQDGSVFLNTGSPHHVQIVDDVVAFPIYDFGKKIRYSEQYAPVGTNVNVVEKIDNGFKMRTYERGVENETLSCGTGATAVAIAMYHLKETNNTSIPLLVSGGKLTVSFEEKNSCFYNIYLKGAAQFVFQGIWNQ